MIPSDSQALLMPAPSPLRELTKRVLFIAAILSAEAVVASLYFDMAALAGSRAVLTKLIASWGAWAVRGVIGFAFLLITFGWLKHKAALTDAAREISQERVRPMLLAAHFLLFGAFWLTLMSSLNQRVTSRIPPDLLAAAWVGAVAAAVVLAALAVMRGALWIRMLRATGWLPVFAAEGAIAVCFFGYFSRNLWDPASRATFQMVAVILRPFVTGMIIQPDRLRIGTQHFTAIVTPECSGLEGAALMIVFCLVWLVLFRDEIRPRRALALIPAGVVVLFLLNAVRIAALILIGDAGAREIAIRGFHSQAGWIAFNAVALGFCVTTRRLAWFSVHPPEVASEASISYPAAPWLVPFLAILAAGMLSRAASGVFEWPYPLRFGACLAALWFFRRSYRDIDWRFGWLAPVLGMLAFLLWIAFDSHPKSGMPADLATAPAALRTSWITLRFLAAATTVPIAEELAFRGFLLRRFISQDFETVSFQNIRWLPLLFSSLVFGILHGGHVGAGVAAGVLYVLAASWRGRLGDAVAAHATTNIFLGLYVLVTQRWYLW